MEGGSFLQAKNQQSENPRGYEKICAILDWLVPTMTLELRPFAAIGSYYLKFIDGCPKKATRLTDLLTEERWRWSEAYQRAYFKLEGYGSKQTGVVFAKFWCTFWRAYKCIRQGHWWISCLGGHLGSWEKDIGSGPLPSDLAGVFAWHQVCCSHMTMQPTHIFSIPNKSPKQARWQELQE